MSFHGGFLGVLVALWLFARRRGKRWLDVTDFVAPLVPLGLAAGRLGNFINGELVGRATSGPWGDGVPAVRQRPAPRVAALPVRAGRRAAVRDPLGLHVAPAPDGRAVGMFLAGYGALRFIAEYAREPDSFLGTLALGLSMGQWLSLPMMARRPADAPVGVPARGQEPADADRPNEIDAVPQARCRAYSTSGSTPTTRSAGTRLRAPRAGRTTAARRPPAAARSRGRC